MKHSATLLAILAVVGFVISPAYADLNNLDVGGKIKAMGVYSNNTQDLNSDDDADQDAFARTELHLWVQAELAENVSARISLEGDRAWSSSDAVLDESGKPVSDQLDIFLEEAFIRMADLYGMPATITVGRQFIEIGDGFVLGDALPSSPQWFSVLGEHEQDPFDAIMVEYELSEDWLLTAVWAKVVETRGDGEDIDHYMANLTFLGLENHVIEGYYLWTKARGSFGGNWGGGSTIANDGLDLHNIGVRAEGDVVAGLGYHGEFVWQFSDQIDGTPGGNQDVSAYALEAGLSWAPEALQQNDVNFGATITYLSGDDDPNDGDYKAYVQAADNRVFGEIADYFQGLVSNNIVDAYFAGVYIINVDAEAALTDRLNAALEGYYFMADKDVAIRNAAGVPVADGGNDDIGWELDGYLNYEVTEDLSAQVAAGFFAPGDAAQDWANGNDDTAWFLRGGVSVNF